MYVKAVYHMTEKNISRQRQIILLCKTLYFEREACIVACLVVKFYLRQTSAKVNDHVDGFRHIVLGNI